MAIDRQFKCIGLREKETGFWRDSFKVGKIYFEADIESKDEVLYLISKNGSTYYVDADQFELVKE